MSPHFLRMNRVLVYVLCWGEEPSSSIGPFSQSGEYLGTVDVPAPGPAIQSRKVCTALPY